MAFAPDRGYGGGRARGGGAEPSQTLAAYFSGLSRACRGARSREGLVLAVLAMLAPKSALRVAAGGSAPPIPSAARRVVLLSGRDGKAGASTELES